VYVAWEQSDGADDYAYAREIDASGTIDDGLEVVREWRLPIERSARDAQRNPGLAESPLMPEGALIAVWEERGDVVLSLRPSPIVELP
jgi:hypothetical protein